MKLAALCVAMIVFLGSLALGFYYLYFDEAAVERAPPVELAEPPDVSGPEHPIAVAPPEPEPSAPPLPALAESDEPARGWLTELLGAAPLERLLVPDNLIRHVVVTIDNLPREKIALQQRPVAPAPGEFLTTGPEDALVLSAENYARYAPFVRLVEAADAQALAALYVRAYPLFQQAYEELGYPDGYFNDRAIEVIDHLLATPEPAEPIELVRPNVFYEFADPELEARSAGQKLLLRMGSENAAIVKAKLRELRDELVSQG